MAHLCFFLSCVCYAFVRVCLFVPCDHLKGRGWPLGSRLWCITVSLSLSHWHPEWGVVLDCMDSWSLHPYLLSKQSGLVAQSVASLAADPGVASLLPAQSPSFLEINHEIISMVILLLRVVINFKWKYVHEVLVSSLVKLAKKKVWLGEPTISTWL